MNIVAFRIPGETCLNIFQAAESENLNFKDNKFRFIVSPFNHAEGSYQFALINTLDEVPAYCVKDNDIALSFPIMDKAEYFNYIEDIKTSLGGSLSKKVVASRRVTVSHGSDINKLLNNLCAQYPDAFIFFISTREFGTWIGASPELLLEKKAERFLSMSLAGTRQASCEGPWNLKNIEEQKIVTDYILNSFKTFNLKAAASEPRTLKAGNISHIMTSIMAEFKPGLDILSLLQHLSPTPALSGFPKEEAMEIINDHEGSRGLYGGFMGPVYSNGDFRLNVILRCAFLQPRQATLFAGGGITCLSDPEAEWIETEKKVDTLRRLL